MTQTRHLVFGAGLIGGYLAGCLLSRDVNTSLVARAKTQVALGDGLKVSDYEGNESRLPSPRFASDDEIFDIIWLTVKCTAVAAALNTLRPFIGPGTAIICCQNGFGSDEMVRNSFSQNTVLSAIVGFNVAESGTASLFRSTQGKLIVEEHSITASFVHEIASALLPVELTREIEAQRWAKLQLNLANPVNALANIPVKAMTEDLGYRLVTAALMKEMLTVTDTLNISLPKVTAVSATMIPKLMRLPDWIFKIVAQKMLAIDPTARTSMWWDLSGGRATEIDYLNGAVVVRANALGLDCPVNAKIVALVHKVESGEESIGFSSSDLKQRLLR